MKRPLQLPLAIALALGGTNAMALGLGPVHVKSKLNQPLDAEIPVIQGTAGEAEGLLVSLAAAEDFDRVGIARSHLNVPLEFSIVKGANGPVIRVTSKEPVHDSYLDFLVEANWPKGRLLREYTVLLDPPVTAPATRSATTTAVTAAPAATPPAAPRREKEKVAAAEKPPAAPAAPRESKPAPAPKVAAAPRKVIEGEYGPTKDGDTLSAIARSTRADSANLDQTMLALLKSNPNAFYKDNINALKRGAILRIPTADEAKAIGSASEAAALVRSQFEDWRGGRATPTRVASTSEKPAAPAKEPKEPKAAKASPTSTASSKTPSERLELVPPKAGKDSMAMADQPGSGSGSSGTGSELKRELARTKEALTARDQESGELKSRVKELEELKGKNDRLINLKDSEIADLQQKLKELQMKTEAAVKAASTAAKTPAPPVAAPATSTAPVAATTTPPTSTSSTATTAIDKKDIWGDAGKSTATTPAGKATDTHAPTTPASTATTTPTAPVTAASTTPSSTASTTPSSTTTTPAPTAATPPGTSTSTTTPATTSTTSPSGTTVTPLAPSPPTTATTGTTVKAPTPTAPKKPIATATTPQPEQAWYDASWVKPAALGGGVLLVLLGLLGMRKRKAVPALATGSGPRGSIADAFGDSPVSGGSSDVMESEAAHLREQLARDPTNPGIYLELLSLYYAERDVAKFEDTAAEMHAYITDPQQPEWQEAQAMGQELAPHNPLFSGGGHYDTSYADTLERPTLDEDDFAFAARHATHAAQTTHEPEFGFGLGELPAHTSHAQPPMHVPPVPPPAEDAFTFDDLPPLDSPRPASHKPMEPVPAMREAPNLDDDFFSGDDAIGTKLDLAKAYMDMGDPDGARSMLEEVIAEGNDAQKAEAHRLVTELR
jgi:pilus assembly protein FimV